MSSDQKKNDHRMTDAVTKRAYAKPRLEDYGAMADLTRSGAGTVDDGGGFGQRSGAAG